MKYLLSKKSFLPHHIPDVPKNGEYLHYEIEYLPNEPLTDHLWQLLWLSFRYLTQVFCIEFFFFF